MPNLKEEAYKWFKKGAIYACKTPTDVMILVPRVRRDFDIYWDIKSAKA